LPDENPGRRGKLPGQFYDIIIVGAGPAGSHTAYKLASSGYAVAVFEEKSAPGLDVCCTGIISSECFHSLDPSPDVILTKVNSARFFSPSGRCLRVHTERVQAYVVNRLLFDKELASKAQAQGARYFFSSPVVDIVPDRDSIQAETLRSGARETFTARAMVLASGFRPKLPRKLGLGRIKSFLAGAQVEVETKDVDEFEVYFGQKTAPGGFAWLVPTSPHKAYVGLLAKSRARLHLEEFFNSLFHQGRVTSRETEIRQKVVPIRTLARSYGDRTLVVGDAAGQVKPTTGGGIYFGHLGAQIAADVLDQALKNDDLSAEQLSRYQERWKARMGKELSRGYRTRWLYNKLNDHQIDAILAALDASGMAQALLNSGSFSFDWHSKPILTILRQSSAYPLLKMKRLLSREAKS
jgi:digeranylgeranylglycerophospholipid reductase